MQYVFILLRARLLWGLPLLLLLLAGCVNPRSRAGERPAALRQLSPPDARLVLGGEVRAGLGMDAVYVAWGKPDHTQTVRAHGQMYEVWSYTHTERGVASGYFGVSRGFAYPAGRGDDGRYYHSGFYGTPDAFYTAPIYDRGLPPPETEVRYRQAVFARGQLVSYEPH